MVAINWHTFFFLLFALLTCVFVLAMLFTSNIVRMAFYLVMTLGAVAGLFFLAGADFVGALQLLIYVGGTVVLLVFGVMLTARTPFVSMRTSVTQWVLAAIVGAPLLMVLLNTAFSVNAWRGPSTTSDSSVMAQPTATPLGLGLMGVRVDKLQQAEPARREGMAGYLLPFEIISVHLLVVLVGAAYLARARRCSDKAHPETD